MGTLAIILVRWTVLSVLVALFVGRFISAKWR